MSNDGIMTENESQPQSQNTTALVTGTPIPKLQLFIVLLIQFAEPVTGLVIYPFVVQFVRESGVTRGDETKSGIYAGLSLLFFISEALTVYQFGRLADIYGRRPVLLLAPLGLGLCMLGFGLSKSFWTLLVLRCAQGAFNGSIGVAKTVLSEISDPTNVADIFSFLPLRWSLGATLRQVFLLFCMSSSAMINTPHSPFVGGLLANAATKWPSSLGKIGLLRIYPYFLPCALAASVAFAGSIFAFYGLREVTTEWIVHLEKGTEYSLAEQTLLSAIERSKCRRGNRRPTETDPLLGVESPNLILCSSNIPPVSELFTREVRIAVLNNGMLCLCDMAAETLIPLVYSTPIALGGLGMKPHDIGVIFGLCAVGNAILQAFLGGRLIRYFGPRRIFIAAFCALTIVFSLYPPLSAAAHRAGRIDTSVSVLIALQLGSMCVMYFAYAAAMLFIIDSAPSRASIGTIVGFAQIVATISRAVAPSLASSLFLFSVKYNLIGGYMAYIALGGITLLAIRCALMLPCRLTSH
ncbi:Major facilitator superfamily multidrug-resistance DHA1 sub-family [Mycena sanguinolenta]|uniref:Major facilitator superfamily multidrug-resistance DHA1 sub-family n=1 Tax=Mycena sanguinolenta TaxID=230812 RepID=A0A8H6ZAT1_9AGAR|nr:Major facilitator superfamily multidrug-resistance DHA1 sub-family [Mycena sanguinolenta]